MSYPKKIKVPSDDTELEFIEIVEHSKKVKEKVIKWNMVKYRYTKSFVFLGNYIEFTPDDFDKSIKNERFISMT